MDRTTRLLWLVLVLMGTAISVALMLMMSVLDTPCF